MTESQLTSQRANEPTNYRANELKGFSLLELLIYIAVIAIITVIISSTFISLNSGRGKAQARAEVDSNLRFALEKIETDIRAASGVSTPATAGSSSATLVLTVSGSTITYCSASGQLRRQVTTACDGTSEAVTASTVTVGTMTFTRLENTNTVLSKTIITIQTQLSMSYNSTSPDYQYSQSKTSTAALR